MPILSDLHIHERTPTILFQRSTSRKESLSSTEAPCKVIHGDWLDLPAIVRQWARGKIEMCKPDALYIMDGSIEEDQKLKEELVEAGVLTPLPKYENCYLTRTDPKDVARVESRTFICTPDKEETIPIVEDGVKGTLGHWISPEDLDERIQKLFPGCMKGRTMYLIPFSMGPVESPLSKQGIELSDSPYVAISMRVMTRIQPEVLDRIRSTGTFVKCLHSVGRPILEPADKDVVWPCNPEETIIAHEPHDSEIISFGSGYGGNSLLGKKCFALRIGSAMARRQGWLAEHMLIMGIEREETGEKKYLCAAFPSACGKTNLAMLCPTLPGYKITCVGDDIAWLRFDDNGDLRAINPENGFFGVAPGTSDASNPVAMQTIFKDTLFTNVALTDDGGVWWEGMTKHAPAHLIDWTGQDWTPECKTKAAHPNSRFCSPAENCPILDEAWSDNEGIKIDAILFGGRRPEGVPLVSEARDWEHAVFMGAGLKSEATAAAEHKGKCVMHDPFSMRPFFGYNFGDYLKHWLSFGDNPKNNLPKAFMVNWFRKDSHGRFLWPGFGDNIRVVDWIMRRCNGEDIAVESPIGYLPKEGSINLDGLTEKIEWEELFSTPRSFWKKEFDELRHYFDQQVGHSLPQEMNHQLEFLRSQFGVTKESN